MDPILGHDDLFALNQLFARLYETSDYRKAFTIFLENLKDYVDFQKGDVYVYRSEDARIDFEDFISVDWDDTSLDKYISQYADIDDALPIVSLRQPVMFRSSDVFIPDERMKTKYYRELLLPAGMEHSIEGNIYVGDDGYVAGIGIHRPNKLGDFTQKELEILKLARPHLVNVARKFIENKDAIDPITTGIAALQDIDEVGICIFDRNFKVQESNLSKSRFIKPEYAGELYRFLLIMCNNLHDKIERDGVLELSAENKVRSRIALGHESYIAEVMYHETSPIEHKYVATVYDLNNVFEKLIQEVKDRYSLTEREYEVLIYAMRGKNNTEIGKELFISVPTVKKHLTNIYQKLGIEGKHQILGTIMNL